MALWVPHKQTNKQTNKSVCAVPVYNYFDQCDHIGRNFAIWAIFFGVGRIFFLKYRPNDLGEFFSKNRPKFTLISSRFGLLFVLKFPNFDRIFLWAKVLIL
jgi:hypothetical protein